MDCLEVCKQQFKKEGEEARTARGKSGGWVAGNIILLNQFLATLAFFGVQVNLVLFFTRVLQQNNAEAANNVSIWTGTVYIFSLVGVFLGDSHWGRYKICAIFQVIFVTGLALLSLSSYIFLIRPKGCEDEQTPCGSHSSLDMVLFYISIYLLALGHGGYQPNIATFGADQFDEQDPKERHSKVAFCRYFPLALNLGSLVSNTILGYFEDKGMWAVAFWVSAGSGLAALVLFLGGTTRYRRFKPSGNKIFVRAASISSRALDEQKQGLYSPWRLFPVTQVEVKRILGLLPIWLCSIIYSVVFTQMASIFVEQGAAMKTTVLNFRIPPASMSSFNILSAAVFIMLYRPVLDQLVSKLGKKNSKGLTELQRMGIGLLIAIMAMLAAGIVECYRLKYANKDCTHCEGTSSLSIFWQVPQYAFIGVSEVFMYVGQQEFFKAQVPDRLKIFRSALCMTSISLGNYISSLLLIMVMKISTVDHNPGWVPDNLNKGHLDRFYFLLAGLTTMDLVVFINCAKWYKCVELEGKFGESKEQENCEV